MDRSRVKLVLIDRSASFSAVNFLQLAIRPFD